LIKIILTILASVYALSPYDILPDFLIGWGWIDDLIILGLLIRYFYLKKTPGAHWKYHFFQQQAKSRFNQQGPQSDTGQPRQSTDATDPHAVLGVPRNAGQDEIKAAYLKLAHKYHPDKVHHLGAEFRDLAETRFKEIQEAYQTLKR